MKPPRKSPTGDPGSRISYLRLKRGLSQEEMAELTGIPLRTYLRIERGEGTSNPGIRYLANICRVLGYNPFADGLGEICRAEWLEWQVFTEDGPTEPPKVDPNPERFVDPDTYY